MFHRLVNQLQSNSFFLFGARGTGKSTCLKKLFQDRNVLWFDLLDLEIEDLLRRNPNALLHEIEAKQSQIEWVVIDEIQKIPELLNLVHKSIESTPVKFALTGSSARKLKHGHANLLAGRAFVNYLFPLTAAEMGSTFNLNDTLQWGTLPKIMHLKTKEEKQAFLRSYAQIYLKEEVWAEHLIRQLGPFRKFLEIAAGTNGDIINFSNIARDVGVDTKTVQSYFEILEDTLLGFILEAHHTSVRKQQRLAPKFYLFDLGVKRALDRTLTQEVLPSTYGYGKAFEHFLITEIYRLNTYLAKDFKLSYLKTKDQAEIDLIIEKPDRSTILIEIKSTTEVDDRDTKTLTQFMGDFKNVNAYVLSRDERPKRINNIHCVPWQVGLKEIFGM